MTAAKPPIKVKPVFGAIYQDAAALANLMPRIEAHFGPADYFSPEYPFDETGYYQDEMGEGLTRRYFSLQPLIYPGALVYMKHMSNQWEDETRADGKRTINLDPGFLHGAKLVLASCKDFSHRVYMGRGVYGEVTMLYEHDSFTRLPWTYGDYWGHRNDFEEIRKLMMRQIKEEMKEGP